MSMRMEIEAAIDKLDDPDKEFIGSAMNYWIVSTVEERKHKKYATKDVVRAVGFKNFNNLGGWSSGQNACSILHNKGYIVVGNDGKPVREIESKGKIIPIPDARPFLMKGTERIWAVAKNYYVEPAIERNQNSVTIDINELQDRMGLVDQHDSVASALNQLKEEKSGTINIEITENQSETTQTNASKPSSSVPSTSVRTTTDGEIPLNLILYGPPGTSKTFDAISLAVEICLGKEERDRLEKIDRSAVVAEYKKLLEQDRIVFVTFHQSFSYEEFVEGLRPATGSDSENGSKTTGGFSLEPNEGVFQHICRNAERAYLTGELDRNRSVYQIGVEYPWAPSGSIQGCLENSVIQNEWAPNFDLTNSSAGTIEEFKTEWEENVNADTVENTGGMRQLFDFRFGIQEGDYVVLANGREKFSAVGKVVGPYYYDRNESHARHFRKVEWLWEDMEGRSRSDIYSKRFLHHATYRLESSQIHWDSLDQLIYGGNSESDGREKPKYVLIIDEINRANISKVFGELITLLEPDKRKNAENEIKVQLPYSRIRFGIPENLHIIGTMNTADRSIALLDTALRRRFKFRELMPDSSRIHDIQLNEKFSLRKFFDRINDRIEYLHDREHQIGHAYFMKCKTKADVENVIRDSVIPLLAEYFYEDRGKIAKVLGDYESEDPDSSEGCFFDMKKLDPDALGLEDEGSSSESKQRWRLRRNFDFSKLK